MRLKPNKSSTIPACRRSRRVASARSFKCADLCRRTGAKTSPKWWSQQSFSICPTRFRRQLVRNNVEVSWHRNFQWLHSPPFLFRRGSSFLPPYHDWRHTTVWVSLYVYWFGRKDLAYKNGDIIDRKVPPPLQPPRYLCVAVAYLISALANHLPDSEVR